MQRALVNQYWEDVQATLTRRTYKTAVGVGWLFEDAGHLTLARGGTFRWRDLQTREQGWLRLPRRERTVRRGGLKKFLAEAVAGTSSGRYLVPKNRKMPVLDAAEGGAEDIFQITINENHKLKDRELTQALAENPDREVLLNWVLSETLFESFTARTLPNDLQGRVRQRMLMLKPDLPSMEYGQD